MTYLDHRFCAGVVLALSVLATPSLAQCALCSKGFTAAEPAHIAVSHNTRTLPNPWGGAPVPGPTFSSDYSFKAITEGAAYFYGGARVFATDTPYDDNPLPQSCFVDNAVQVDFSVSALTLATPGIDFELKYDCCPSDPDYFTPVPTTGSYQSFFLQKVYCPPGEFDCACPPQANGRATLGYLVLDMTSTAGNTQNGNENWENPEEFGVKFESASPVPPASGMQDHFAIANVGIGPVWIIQDSCESASLFTYGPLPPCAEAAMLAPTVQLASEFGLVLGDPIASLCTNYYNAQPMPNQRMSTYVNQNWPGAGAEVVIEGDYLELLLGLIDRNVSCNRRVDGQFYSGLPHGERIVVDLMVKDITNWGGGACPGKPGQYPYATAGDASTSGLDFIVEEWLFDNDLTNGTTCTGGNPPYWSPITPTQNAGGNWIYQIEFRGETLDPDKAFKQKLRGLRVAPLIDDDDAEGPEIVHLEVAQAWYHPAVGSPTPVDVGWSKAFRIVVLDPRD